MQLQGALSAIITPFSGGQIDEGALRALIDWQIEQGVSGIVPTGTTGESATLSHEEHRRVVEIVVDQAKGRVPVVAGTGSNNTAEAVSLTKHAKDSGAAASLQISPYYNKPTQEGLYRHFATIAEEADLPILLYNIPGRTSILIAPETTIRLAKVTNVIGIKEATGSMDYTSEVLAALGPDNFIVLSGDDSLTLPLMAIGAKGTITASANVIPNQMSEICRLCLAGDFAAAREIHLKVFDLIKTLFCETNPIPVKTGVELLGRGKAEFRLPLTPMSDTGRARLETEMKKLGLIG
ncbi:MAG: 4-hydroxy-tetrahydrodipicolinate synthase [Chrysiogenetes bacterium]|nr:4-hydroxy-tetrahydrodipicolinate synthase [Chrysiogenetes bacterium]